METPIDSIILTKRADNPRRYFVSGSICLARYEFALNLFEPVNARIEKELERSVNDRNRHLETKIPLDWYSSRISSQGRKRANYSIDTFKADGTADLIRIDIAHVIQDIPKNLTTLEVHANETLPYHLNFFQDIAEEFSAKKVFPQE